MSKHDRALCFMIGAVGDKKTATSGTTAALFSFLKATVFLYKRWPKDFYDTHLDNTDNFLKRQARCLDIWANVDLCNSCDTAWLVLNVLNVQVIGKRVISWGGKNPMKGTTLTYRWRIPKPQQGYIPGNRNLSSWNKNGTYVAHAKQNGKCFILDVGEKGPRGKERT